MRSPGESRDLVLRKPEFKRKVPRLALLSLRSCRTSLGMTILRWVHHFIPALALLSNICSALTMVMFSRGMFSLYAFHWSS